MKIKYIKQDAKTTKYLKRSAILALTAVMLLLLAACGAKAPPAQPVTLPADISELPEPAAPEPAAPEPVAPEQNPDSGATQDNSADGVQDIGQGSRTFRFEVTDDSEKLSVWNVSTDETTVGDALIAAGLIKGDVSEYGFYVTEVNGLTADFDDNESWWGFFIDGEMAMAGVDATDIEEGKVYAFIYKVG